jgi:hypothetical protein
MQVTHRFGLRFTTLALTALAVAALGGGACGGKVVVDSSGGTGGLGGGASPSTAAIESACEKFCTVCQASFDSAKCAAECPIEAAQGFESGCTAVYVTVFDCYTATGTCHIDDCHDEGHVATHCFVNYCASHPSSANCGSSSGTSGEGGTTSGCGGTGDPCASSDECCSGSCDNSNQCG